MPTTRVASSASNVVLLASSTLENRKSVVVCNDDANRLYVLLDAGTASTTNYSFSLAQNENASIANYNGDVKGIWASAGSGGAQVTTIHG